MDIFERAKNIQRKKKAITVTRKGASTVKVGCSIKLFNTLIISYMCVCVYMCNTCYWKYLIGLLHIIFNAGKVLSSHH